MVQEGTGQRLRELGRPLAGKTGTTNEQGDAWFMGFSPEIATGVWVGHDDNRLLGWARPAPAPRSRSGGISCASRWPTCPRTTSRFRSRTSASTRCIDCGHTGLVADADTPNAYFQPFIAGTEPQLGLRERESSDEAQRALRDDVF